MKRGGRRVADGNEGARGESQSGEQIMMRWWWGRRGAKWAHVNDGTLKKTFGTFLLHSVGGVREDVGDETGPAPSHNVLRSSSGALNLGVGGRHVNFYAVVDQEVGGGAVFIQSFGRCLLHIGVVRCGKAVEGSGRGLKGLSECGGRDWRGRILAGGVVFRVG